MCFSASASFIVGTGLIGLGAVCLKSVSDRRAYAYAAMPLLFGIQQLIEGVVWLTFIYPAPQIQWAATQLYSFFAYVLWPVYVPASAWLIEPQGPRRRVLFALMGTGLFVGTWLLLVLLVFPVAALPIGHHIEYQSGLSLLTVAATLYLLSTTASLMLSSHAAVKAFGVLALLSSMAAYFIYAQWFVSIFCFFSAVLSVLVYFQLVPRRWNALLTPMATRLGLNNFAAGRQTADAHSEHLSK